MVQVVSILTTFKAKDEHGYELRAMLSAESRFVRVTLDMYSLDGNGWVPMEVWIGDKPPTLDQLIALRRKLKQWGVQSLEERLLDEIQVQTSLRLGKPN